MKILDFNNNYNWTYIKAPVDIKAQDDDLIINFSLKFQTDIPEIVVIYHNINNYNSLKPGYCHPGLCPLAILKTSLVSPSPNFYPV